MKFLKILSIYTFSLFYIAHIHCYTRHNVPKGFVKIKGGRMYAKDKTGKNSGIITLEPFFVSPFKVTNRDYKNVMLYAKNNKMTESFEILVPDYSINIDSVEQYGIKSGDIENYFENYDDYPVVGLTYRQIIEFINIKSKMDKVRYRLLTPEEYDFIAYEVENIDNGNGGIEIIQNDCFDDTTKDKLVLDEKLEEYDNKLKDAQKSRCGKICNKKNKKKSNVENKNIKKKYNFLDYYNLRSDVVVSDIYGKVFFSKVNKYSPNSLGVYDIVGNTLEITSPNRGVCFNLDAARNTIFLLCGGSCFDFYNLVKIENKQIDRYNVVRYDRGFRLVVEIER